ncbi:dihydrofolate reductase family protein [Psychrobacillus sp. OK032]|uniref:dihydrofolate reductase family protein n=1 Tax=Psychrobacillus sp. OK032 TaxID=1884358 RepID=UPI0008C14AD2|nr:dihydrofolate reductase family protein [Psychrobacillus sp. OK032]SES37231.1 Dihydrofolate reductase [Psychrobacillus sp. OK032]
MTNQRKVVLFIATSLDGYIATENDSLDWLFKVEGEGDNGYSEFYDTVDTVIMGRRTYDWVMEQEMESFPYEGKECYVFSRTVSQENENVQFFSRDVVDFTNQLKNKEGKNIWVMGGGDLLHSFIKNKLVDEMIVTVSPVIIGKGIPLFKEMDFETGLTLKSINRFNQFAELHYEVKR